MGLDQYLYRTINPDLPVDDSEDAYNLASVSFGEITWGEGEDHPQSYANFKRHLATFTNIEQVAQWRKFNALHLWMERNCFGGEESNCDRIPVNLEQLAGLQVTCERVAADPSLGEDNLPTGGRFFFGSTDYDEWYVKDCEETAELLKNLIAEEATFAKDKGCTRQFFYSSSW